MTKAELLKLLEPLPGDCNLDDLLLKGISIQRKYFSESGHFVTENIALEDFFKPLEAEVI